jgi:hypothetical protein
MHSTISQSGMVKALVPLCLLGFLAVLAHPIGAQESASAEKICDVSPDKKFAMRIRYEAETNKQLIEGEKAAAEKIFFETIKAIELLSLPSRQGVANLLPDEELGGGNNYDDITLVWSPDSKWCAFYWNFPRVGYTTVYRQRGDKFVELNKHEDLKLDVKGDVRNEYIRPLRWKKPGVLVLEQLSIFRGGEIDDAKFQFTASFDDKGGKFRVISKKKLHPDVKKED